MAGVQVPVLVEDIDTALVSYDSIRMFRSTGYIGGPWSEITATVATRATLVNPNLGPYACGGKWIDISVDRADPIRVTFPAGAPRTATQVVADINALFAPDIADVFGAYVRLRSSTTGLVSRVDIVAVDDDTYLGWEGGETNTGKATRITLDAAHTAYWFADVDGDLGYLYRYALHNSVTAVSEALSPVYYPQTVPVLATTLLAIATIRLVDLRGHAMGNRQIVLTPIFSPDTIAGYGVGLGADRISFVTDGNGYGQVTLVRGTTVRVSIDTTSIARTILVPDVDSFDLLTAMDLGLDPFTLTNIVLPAAPRTTP